MTKGMRLYLASGAVLVVLYLLAQYYRPRDTDWNASYLKEDKIPFGLYILNKELPAILPNTVIKTTTQLPYNTLKGKNQKNTLYLMVCSKLDLSTLDYRELLKFMRGGNHVFIATFDPGRVLKKALKLDIKSLPGVLNQRKSTLNFVNPVLKDGKGYTFDKGLGSHYFSKFDLARATVLGKNGRGEVNFLKYTFGKGALYLLPDPKLLTNYSLLQPQGAAYAGKVLSYLPAGQTVLWDELNTRGNGADTSILRVFFKHPPLRWAYLISILGLLVFVLFEIKRRQRVIPAMEPLKNTSLDFVKVIGKLYYQQRNNKDIAQKKISYFLEFLRSSYRLNTNAAVPELIETIRLRSGARQGTLQNLFASIKMAEQTSQVTDKELIDLNEYMEEFYKQAQ